MLKKITIRHKEVMRRLLVAETPKEIAEELNLATATINGWLHDPLFASTLSELEYETRTKILGGDGRVEALEVITNTMKDAAILCRETVGNPLIDRSLRLKSAWDVLDRGGLKPTDKKLVGHINLSDLIIEARKQREAEKENDKPIEVTRAGGEQ